MSALTKYVLAATFARAADGGAVVAVVLLVISHGGSSHLAGLLGACITAPHMLGPLLARRIDLAQDGRKVISLACAIYSLAFSLAVLTYGEISPWVTGILLATSGCSGPLLTGGISSRLPSIVSDDVKSQRRAQAWDVATYGLGGTIGPSLVAGVSAYCTSAQAAFCLALAAMTAAILMLRLPFRPPVHGGDVSKVPGVWATISMMGKDGRLRRTLYMTTIVSFSMASLPITAVQMTTELGVAAASAAFMTAAYGIGNLSGSAFVMIRPLSGSPDQLMSRFAALVVLGLLGVLCTKYFTVLLCAYWAAGVLNAFFFASTLAARSEYSPPTARGQVFLWVAALKITAGSAGTATAGALIGLKSSMPLLIGIILITSAVIYGLAERRTEGNHAKWVKQ